MRPAVEAFNQSGDVAAFRRQLLANPALEESILTAATRAAEAEAQARGRLAEHPLADAQRAVRGADPWHGGVRLVL